MYVSNYMTKNVITIDHSATISDALSVMNDTKAHRLPVMKNGKMVGLITDGNIQKASPTKATSLSIYEINYLLAKTRVADYMTKNVITIQSNQLLEEAVRTMRENNVSCLPVIDNESLVGIITEDDVFDALLSLLGFNEKSTRIAIDILEDNIGVIADISHHMKEGGASITHMTVYNNEDNSKTVVIRIRSLDTGRIEESLRDAGYIISSVTRNEE